MRGPEMRIKLWEVLGSLRSASLGLESGIASFDVEDNHLHLVTNDNRDIWITFPLPNPGNKVTNMVYYPHDHVLAITERVNGHKVRHDIYVPERTPIQDNILATQTVGGVPKGKNYPAGYSLESIVRQILSGSPWYPEVTIIPLYEGFDELNRSYYLDKIWKTTLPDKVPVTVTTKVPDDAIEDMEIESAYIEYPEFHEDFLISDPLGETFSGNYDFTGVIIDDFPDEYYTVHAYAVDQRGHVGHDSFKVEWIVPIVCGYYDGVAPIQGLVNDMYVKEGETDPTKKYIPVEELTSEQWTTLFRADYFDPTILEQQQWSNPGYDPVSDPRNDPTKNPDYAILPFYDPSSPDYNPDYDISTPRYLSYTQHFVTLDPEVTYNIEEDFIGKIWICFPIERGIIRKVYVNDVDKTKEFTCSGYDSLLYEKYGMFILMDRNITEYKSGDEIKFYL